MPVMTVFAMTMAVTAVVTVLVVVVFVMDVSVFVVMRLLARFCISRSPLAARVCQRAMPPAARTKFFFHSYTS